VNDLSYCPKCGNKIDENMTFCPKCGAALKGAQTQPQAQVQAPPTYRRHDEKGEKGEKGEKREKREHPYIGPLIGGLVVLFLGVWFYLEAAGIVTPPDSRYTSAFIFIIIGVVIIIAAIYGSIMIGKRYPKTS
jgi:hypothetical protein